MPAGDAGVGGKRGLRVERQRWGDTTARKMLINDQIVVLCGLKGKGKGRGRDKEGRCKVEEANRSKAVVILQSFLNFTFLLCVWFFVLFFFLDLSSVLNLRGRKASSRVKSI